MIIDSPILMNLLSSQKTNTHKFNANMMNKQEIKTLLPQNPVIFEIGAADGLDTLSFIETFNDQNFKLYCFEPDPRNIEMFKTGIRTVETHNENVSQTPINDHRVKLIEAAVGNANEKTTFNQSNTIYSSSIKNPNIDNLNASYPNLLKFNNSFEVDVVTLDKFIQDNNIDIVDFIWADVQGAEDLMLYGAKESLKNKIRYIYTEYSKLEYYENAPTLNSIANILGSDWELISDFGTDALFKNKNL